MQEISRTLPSKSLTLGNLGLMRMKMASSTAAMAALIANASKTVETELLCWGFPPEEL